MAIFRSRGVDPLYKHSLVFSINFVGKKVIRVCNPSNLSSKALDVVLLSLQNVLGNEKRERTIPDAHLLDLVVEPVLDGLPHEVGRGLFRPS